MIINHTKAVDNRGVKNEFAFVKDNLSTGSSGQRRDSIKYFLLCVVQTMPVYSELHYRLFLLVLT